MALENIIEMLEGVSEDPAGKVSLYFTRKDYKCNYTSFKPSISIPLQKELLNIANEALKELSKRAVTTFNPTGSLDDTLEVIDYVYVDSLSHILESLKEERLLTDIPDDISKFNFYCLVIKFGQDDNILLFRRLTRFKKLQKGIVGRFISGEFEKIDAELLGIDNFIDIIGCNNELTVAAHISMERIFDIKTQYQENAKRTLEIIKETNKIENFDQFQEDSINDGRIIRGLTKLLKEPERVKKSLEKMDKIKDLVNLVELDIKFTDDGKMLYERKDQLQNITLIIRDAYYQSYINERLGVDEMA
ncbi:permease component [Desulfitobacterium hafniense]|uniref:Permease component n=1 Tax=Desulfitobacterium hafniense TaxID=49338 RepID=A0A098AZ01_DESHA|nr:Kiwa anti-phage protein KwaB-like domain-containing protein [Desulfitobacterium hafniense]CDX00846.1 permease component [Desulfitobacterium hafniense]